MQAVAVMMTPRQNNQRTMMMKPGRKQPTVMKHRTHHLLQGTKTKEKEKEPPVLAQEGTKKEGAVMMTRRRPLPNRRKIKRSGRLAKKTRKTT